jgi:hypothetical protein
MKIKFIATLLLISFFTLNIFSQNSESEVKGQLIKLFELSKAKNYEKAASLISYDGENKERVNKDSFNPATKEELEKVKRICKKISALIDLSSKYEIGETKVEKINNDDSYSIDVVFTSGTQKLATTFNFTKTGKGFLLSKMN